MLGLKTGAISLIFFVAAAWNGPATAQEVLREPGAVRSCLCAQQAVTALLDTLHERQQSYDTSQKALASLDAELADRRSKIDVYNGAEVDAYKQLLQKHDNAAAAFNGEVTASYNAAVSRYNQALAGYNSSCAGRSYDGAAYQTAQIGLSCPKP